MLKTLLQDLLKPLNIPFRENENDPILTTLYAEEEAIFLIAENKSSVPVKVTLPFACCNIFDDTIGRVFDMEAESCMLFAVENGSFLN